MAKKEEIEMMQKIEKELKTEYEKTHVPKEDYDKLKNAIKKIPQHDCPECGHKFPPLKLKPKDKKE